MFYRGSSIMSERHPIIAITGSSGAGTSTVTRTFAGIFAREGVKSAVIEGDSFHRYDRAQMKEAVERALSLGEIRDICAATAAEVPAPMTTTRLDVPIRSAASLPRSALR